MGKRDDRPAETWSMAIVHAALQRDLDRTRRELTTTPYPEKAQRRALGEHVLWMMDFLHHHHSSEDTGLYPLVRRRNPEAASLFDSLEAEHARVTPAITRLVDVASSYRDSRDDAVRLAMLDALNELDVVLTPHLDREVAEAMPVVAATISNAEWEEWDNRYNIKPNSPRQLAFIGHWIVEGCNQRTKEMIFGLVPPVPRFILDRAFGPAYRRSAQTRWRASTVRPVTVEV